MTLRTTSVAWRRLDACFAEPIQLPVVFLIVKVSLAMCHPRLSQTSRWLPAGQWHVSSTCGGHRPYTSNSPTVYPPPPPCLGCVEDKRGAHLRGARISHAGSRSRNGARLLRRHSGHISVRALLIGLAISTARLRPVRIGPTAHATHELA